MQMPPRAGFCAVAHEVLLKGDDSRVVLRHASSLACGFLPAVLRLAQLRSMTCAILHALADGGARAGDRVAVVGDNSAAHVALQLAAALSGLVIVAADALAHPGAWAEIAMDAEVRMMCVDGEEREERLAKVMGESCEVKRVRIDVVVEKAVKGDVVTVVQMEEAAERIRNGKVVSGEEPWVIMYTSGTSSGKKKGAVRSQRASIDGFYNHLSHMSFTDKDKFMAIYPMHGISTFFFSFMTLYFGGEVIISNRKDCQDGQFLLDVLRKYNVTFTTGGPSHFLSMIDAASSLTEPFEPVSLRQILVSGAMTSKATQDRIKQFFRFSKFFEVYGSTECGLITILSDDGTGQGAGSVGKEPPGVHQLQFSHPETGERIVPTCECPGEILAATPMMFSHYWNRPNLTNSCFTEDGYFRTGDLGYKDENGFLFLVGRADDRINLSTGQAFYPSEVERVLLSHPIIHFCIVFHSNKVRAGTDTIIAAALLNESAASLDPEACRLQLVEFCTGNLSPTMVPAIIWLVSSMDDLPRTSTGKVQRKALEDTFLSSAHSQS